MLYFVVSQVLNPWSTNHPLFDHLLPPGLVADCIRLGADRLTIEAHTTSPSASCPNCQHVLDRVHYRYVRSPRDLPIGQYTVRLVLHVRRFACRNPGCPKRTFAERLPEFLPAHAQRTLRLSLRLQMLGLALGGRAGARLGNRLGLPASRHTLLRLVSLVEPPERPAPRGLGVDDFARKRGRSYGTILVDLERRWPVDLLPERSADVLKAWLACHPGVEVITRDRSREYALGATEGAPKALQVADRWHLLVNLREALERYLAGIHARLRRLPVDTQVAQVLASGRRQRARPLRGPSPSEQIARQARRESRKVLWQSARGLFVQGIPIREIARRLDLSWTTACNFAHAEGCPERSPKSPQASLVDPYVDHLTRLWDEGCHNASQLWRELQERGYEGARIQVARWARHKREEPALSTPREHVQAESGPLPVGSEDGRARLKGARELVWMLLHSRDKLDEDDKVLLDHLRQDQELGLVHDLAQRFAEYIERDVKAVRAGMSEPWSNGQTEGQITKLKLLKRQMYGRASFELLRRRVLNAG